jgi:phosphate transport system substrate-binding protein
MRTRLGSVGIGVVAVLSVVLAAHGQGTGPQGTAPMATGGKVLLRGAGATFPAPLYKKWIETFVRQNPDVVIEYSDVGSGEGVRRFLANAVDFAASDGALSDEQLARVQPGARLVPATAGMVVLAYNLPELVGDLRLSRDVYVDILAGRILKWNDPRIRAINPDLALPNRNITVVARQDSSGTTFALTNHLSAISPAWRDHGPGIGYVVDWGAAKAMLARGNEGVASRIKISDGAIGYVEHGFARRLGLPTARLQNKAGHYVAPGDRGGQAALDNAVTEMPSNLRLFLPDPDGEGSYPIVSFSWLLLYAQYPDQQKSSALKRFVSWGLSHGQTSSPELGYIALPASVASLSRAAVERIQ